MSCKDSERAEANEFFQLFKTPWEWFVPEHRYDVVIVASETLPAGEVNALLLLVFSSSPTTTDKEIGIVALSKFCGSWLEWNGTLLPVYGGMLTFKTMERVFVRARNSADAVGVHVEDGHRHIVRMGYDLFAEIGYLISKGQPAENATIPTLELHIAMLRDRMSAAGIAFIEIPPVPAGYDFMGCLTHDVDFIGIRQHKFDHTMWGFAYRGSIGSAVRFARQRMSWKNVIHNFKAVLSLPFVYLGLLPDFWLEFERYSEIERGLGSTYFFLPFKERPGVATNGFAHPSRAAKYDVSEEKTEIDGLLKQDCEIGLHGIDAWHSAGQASEEKNRISEVTGQTEIGVRMHWLFFSETSPKSIEDGGLSYDSTLGYNDAVGFRAGTGQVFLLPGTNHLLELPLNIQDTALFYPDRMNLDEEDALIKCREVLQSVMNWGGSLTVNWHTRSLSPERLWGGVYKDLLNEIKKYRVWFSTAGEIVRWFRGRRGVTFESVEFKDRQVFVKMCGPAVESDPPFLLRVHHPMSPHSPAGPVRAGYVDMLWDGRHQVNIPIPEST